MGEFHRWFVVCQNLVSVEGLELEGMECLEPRTTVSSPIRRGRSVVGVEGVGRRHSVLDYFWGYLVDYFWDYLWG